MRISTSNPLYPVGESLHYQVNEVWLAPASPIYQSATILAELAGSHILDIWKNADNLSVNARHTSLGFRGVFDPAYYQVLPQLDMDVPVGLGWNFQGRSPTTAQFNNDGAAYGGDVSVGLNFVYRNLWRGGVSYTRFIGGKAVANNGYVLEPYLDRDFVSFSIQRTF